MKRSDHFQIYSTEDNPAHQELLEIAFQRTKGEIKVNFFETAEAMLAGLKQASETELDEDWLPHLFLVDISLPGMSGIELVKALRNDPVAMSTPIVMLSSSSAFKDREAAFLNGADDYFTKPSSFRDLVEMMGFIVSDWQNAKAAEESGSLESRRFLELRCSDWFSEAIFHTFLRVPVSG